MLNDLAASIGLSDAGHACARCHFPARRPGAVAPRRQPGPDAAVAKATTWRQLEARLNLYRIHARAIREQIALRADRTVPRFDPFETNPADAARLTRMQWQLPVGPVRRLVRWIEASGCLVVSEDFGTDRIDGMSQWVDDVPIMLINTAAPTDRLRLTLAHERTLRTNQLPDLKLEWGVSMAVLTERAYALGTITPSQRTSFYKMMSARGWRQREPRSGDLPPESPELSTAVADALVSRGLSDAEIATMAGFATPDDNTLFVPSRRRRLHVI
jgi:Zn-dependent peptidase ImmA (M78 family)